MRFRRRIRRVRVRGGLEGREVVEGRCVLRVRGGLEGRRVVERRCVLRVLEGVMLGNLG